VAAVDIRLDIGALKHPKLIALRHLLGADAVLALIELWCFTAKYHSGGTLSNMDASLVAIAAGWPVAKASEFIGALIDLRLLDVRETDHGAIFSVHNWRVMQPWAYHAEKRSKVARTMAKRRWDKKLTGHAKGNAKGNAVRITSGNAPSPDPIPIPSPTPTPNPKPEVLKGARQKTGVLPPEPARVDHRLHWRWLRHGYKGNWSGAQFAAVNAGIKRLHGDEAAVIASFDAYLLETKPFFDGHPPEKWAQNPGGWPKPVQGIPELLKQGSGWVPPDERMKGGMS
jgi:hypothetical protein